MPKFKPNDDLFQGFDFQSNFQSSLPSTEVTQGQGMSGIYSSIMAPGNFEYLYGKNFVDVGKRTSGQIASQFGIPAKLNTITNTFKGETYGQFEQIFELLPIKSQIVDAFDRIKAGLDVADAMSDISDAMEGISAIPIIGWIVDVGVQFAKQLTGMFHFFDTAWEKEKKEVPSAAFVYKKEVDAQVTRHMLQAITESDWTRIFWPGVDARGALGQHAGEQLDIDEIQFITTGGKGTVVRPSGGNARGGLGVFPGVAKIMDFAQYGNNSTYQEFQDIHPSAMQTGQLLWQLVNKNSPEMFRVDTRRLGDPWSQFFDSLEIWPDNVDDLLSKKETGAIWQAKRMMTVGSRSLSKGKPVVGGPEQGEGELAGVGPRECYGAGGWRIYDPFADRSLGCGYNRPASVPSVPEKFRTVLEFYRGSELTGETMTYRGIADWKIDVLWQRQKAALKTITCAYVDKSFPAIKGSPVLEKLWRESRAKLLHYSAKMAVDVTMIPDGAYRSAMISAQKSGGLGIAAEGKKVKVAHLNLSDMLEPMQGAPSSAPFMVIPAGDEIGGGGAVTGRSSKKKKKSAVPLMIGAAIVLGIMSQRK